MNQATGKPLTIAGKKVTAETTFKAKKSSGTVEVTFVFDGSDLGGKTTVVFESLTYKETEIAVHADIEDEAQTIMFPKLKTTAKDGGDGDQEVMETSKATIVDSVSYENLIPGKTYHVTGILMDKTTGAELMVNGAAVTAEAVFKAEQSKGSVDVEFVFDASELANHELVVFESLFYVDGEKDVLISEHKDINDRGQTVKVVGKEIPPTTPEVKTTQGPKTGDKSPMLVFIALLFLSGGVATGVARKWKKRRNVHKEI